MYDSLAPLRSLALAAGLTLAAPASAQSIVVAPPANTCQLRAGLAGQHPRLYFTAADIADLRAHALGDRSWFYQDAKDAFGHYAGTPVNIDDSWKEYLFGFWGQFAMSIFYLAEEDQLYADTAIDWALDYARRSDWLADDLVPMDITSGMALTYDILYDQLTEPERAELRAALFAAADFIYDEFFIGEYWTQDFQNNHMHNRMHGLAHAALAILGDDPAYDTQPHADLAVGCMQQLVDWLPEDGSTHEGPGYWSYGHHWVVRTAHLLQHTTGVDYEAQNPHFSTDHLYRIYLTTPGWAHSLNLGDGGAGEPGNLTTLARPIGVAQDERASSVLDQLMAELPGAFYQHSAWGVLWYDAALPRQPITELPLYRVWPDLDMLSIRSGWDADATAFVFKCGPPGGHKMQQRRGDGWINVAHDHPDQNHFLLFAHGAFLAEDDGYPRDQKLTRSHNTMVIDGAGGPEEGTAWYQPFDYAQAAFARDLFAAGALAYGAGDASPLYPGAERFVRHALFAAGDYVVLVDELVGAGATSHSFEWRLHKDGVWAETSPGQYSVTDGDVSLAIELLAPAAVELSHSFLPAELTAAPCLAVSTDAVQTRFVAVLVPQQSGVPQAQSELLAATGGELLRVQVAGSDDLFAVAIDGTSVDAGVLTLEGAAGFVRRSGAQAQRALLTRGTSLRLDGARLLGADLAVNLAWEARVDGAAVEAEPPYKTALGAVELQIGGLLAGARYSVTADGVAAAAVDADISGVARVNVDLASRRVVVLRALGASMDAGVAIDSAVRDVAATDAAQADTRTLDSSFPDATATDFGFSDPGSRDSLLADTAAIDLVAITAEPDGGSIGVGGEGCACRSSPAATALASLALLSGLALRRRRRP